MFRVCLDDECGAVEYTEHITSFFFCEHCGAPTVTYTDNYWLDKKTDSLSSAPYGASGLEDQPWEQTTQ